MNRRAKGDGGLSWDAARERWVASATIGHDGRGKRLVCRGRGRTIMGTLKDWPPVAPVLVPGR